MTMSHRIVAGLAALAALVVGTQTVRADDVIRLKATPVSNGQTITLGNATDAEIELARYGYRGGFHGGYRGGFAGYRGGFYGGYRGGYYGGYRGYYGGYRGYAGYYRPYYGGYGGYYRPYYASYYSPYYYGGYGYGSYGGYGYGGYGGYGYGGYGYGCSNVYAPVVTNYTYTQPYYSSVVPYGTQQPVVINGYSNGNGNVYPYTNGNGNGNYYPPMPQVNPGNGTYPYDGGPSQPVPMPQQQLTPAKTAPHGPVADLRLVSTTNVQPKQQQQSQFAYPAYGEDNRANGFAIDRPATKKTNR